MTNRELVRQKQRLDTLFKNRALASYDIELLSHWAKYLCVLVAGFLENSLKELYGEFAKRSASPQVASFASATLQRIRNADSDRFLNTAGGFSKAWKGDLKAFMDENGRKEAINSIIGQRHLIAHGRSSTITLAGLQEYVFKAVEVIDFIEEQCQREG